MIDKFAFDLFEILFFSIFLYSIWKDKIWPKRSVVSSVTRGERSRKIILTSASAITTLVVSNVFLISTFPKDGKLLLYLVNLGVIMYLFFYSGWFTNMVIGWWIKLEQRNFNPHGQ